MLASPALAARILVLTTTENPSSHPDAVTMTSNCIQEFQTISATPVDVKTNMNAAGTLTMADFAPAYDIVAVCAMYEAIHASNVSVLEQAAKTRAAQAFFIFADSRSPASGPYVSGFSVIGNSKAWTLNQESSTGTLNAALQLNTNSKYQSDFASADLNPYYNHWLFPYSGVPTDNALYLMPGTPLPAPGSTVTAAAIFVPQTESYLDGSNVPQGACLFFIADLNGYVSTVNTGKIAQAALNAITPGSGACFMAPAAPFGAAVPANSTGWLLALAALLSVMTLLGFRNQRA
ncbi:MAG: hypothetical protein LBP52_00405 [Burkholderiaceae bacterium]|jgi:hypothetical protein|nr:hypothetical protein [Burkholderiaceae bacterium]